MKYIAFEWDKNKNILNQKKHGINFEEAKTVFYDDNARLIHDPDHSLNEDRFILLGLSTNFRILTVIHTYRKNDEIIRIISARKATKNETKHYKWRR
ncbi:BrnT family toxin [candidate division KSB1 bacterium]|nr:BrnT family toxin [candidate division KSB1 bacterium]